MAITKYQSLIVLFLLSFVTIATAQEVQCDPVDRDELDRRLNLVRDMDQEDPGMAIVEVGKSFLGTPYLAHTLEGNEMELLVLTFQGLDCTTFVENVLAFYLVYRKKEYSFDAFTQSLKQIRYRHGEIKGYPSRLHYFTEWIADNSEKGLIRDLTLDLGGKEQPKKRNFMSQHRKAYAALVEDEAFQGILKMEAELAASSYAVLGQNDIEKAESEIKNGDIIAFATSIDGLDVTHTGLAIWQGKRVHLLHASSSGQVEITTQPLADYAKGIRGNTGLIVARVVQ